MRIEPRETRLAISPSAADDASISRFTPFNSGSVGVTGVEAIRLPVVRPARDLFPALLSAALILLVLFSLTLGRYPLSFAAVARIVFTTFPIDARGNATDMPWVLVEVVRLPRVLLVTLCGMGLALSGAAMQGVFRNPLVTPEITGASGGASVGGLLALMLSWPAPGVVGLAFACGILALVATAGLAQLAGRMGTLTLVLSGMIVGAFCGALVGLLLALADPLTKLPTLVYWLLGSFVGASYDKLATMAAAMLFAGTLLLALRWRLNLLSLGQVDARALGINVGLLRWTFMALVTLIVAAQVSVSGVVPWVGLVVPHLARMLVGPEHTKLLPTAALLGGFYLLAMDDLARTVMSQDIPIGLLTSLVGTPIFGFLLWKTQSRGWARD
jgi:iron complex transport system permease protein